MPAYGDFETHAKPISQAEGRRSIRSGVSCDIWVTEGEIQEFRRDCVVTDYGCPSAWIWREPEGIEESLFVV